MLGHASLYKCTPVGRATGLMKAPTLKLLNSMTSAWFSVFGLANRGSGQPRFQLWSPFAHVFQCLSWWWGSAHARMNSLHENRIKLWTNATSSRTPGRFYTWISYTNRHQRDGRLRSPPSSPGVPWINFFSFYSLSSWLHPKRGRQWQRLCRDLNNDLWCILPAFFAFGQ